MNDLFIIDNYVDEREFRNYINNLLEKRDFKRITIDDVRIADRDKFNDNDMLAKKGELIYTIQTFLNKDINKKQIDETLKDMEKEHVSVGIIITNNYVSNEVKEYANQKLIQIWDRFELEKEIDWSSIILITGYNNKEVEIINFLLFIFIYLVRRNYEN